MSTHLRAKALLKSRRELSKIFKDTLFSDPALTILLDLFVTEGDGKYATIGVCCIAAGVPQTTALRYITDMVHQGLLRKRPHPTDGRSTVIELQPETKRALADWIEETTNLISGDTPKPSSAPSHSLFVHAPVPQTASPS